MTRILVSSCCLPQIVLGEVVDVQWFASLSHDLLLLFSLSLLLSPPLLSLEKFNQLKSVSSDTRKVTSE